MQACTDNGSTPTNNTPSAIIKSIENIKSSGISLNWTLVTTKTSNCYSSSADTQSYKISTPGTYCVIFACGGNGACQTGGYLTTPGTVLYKYASHTSTGYACMVDIRFITVDTGTVSWVFPRQSNARGTGLLFKIT